MKHSIRLTLFTALFIYLGGSLQGQEAEEKRRVLKEATEVLQKRVDRFGVAEPIDKAGTMTLFNGKDLKGWGGNLELWSVKDGVIHGETTKEKPIKGNTFLVWTNGVVDDFEIHLQFRIVNGNSGIQYRSKVTDTNNWVVGGYQADFEAGTTYSGILYEERGRGILAGRGEKTVWGADGKKQVVGKTAMSSEQLQDSIKKEDWNDYEVIAHGNHYIHKINGNVTVEVTDEDEKKMQKSGVLALQIHAGPPMVVEFKNIHLKKLK